MVIIASHPIGSLDGLALNRLFVPLDRDAAYKHLQETFRESQSTLQVGSGFAFFLQFLFSFLLLGG